METRLPFNVSVSTLAIFVGITLFSSVTHADPTLTDLGTFGGSNITINTLLISSGPIVIGESNLTGDSAIHPYRWYNNQLVDIGTLGGSYAYVDVVSADGSAIAGNSQLSSGFSSHAYRWQNGVMTDLGTLGGSNSYSDAISANGLVVAGHSQTTGDAATHSYRWVNGIMTDLGTLGGTNGYFGRMRISNDGDFIAGNSYVAGDVNIHTYRWTNGTMTDLGTLGGSNSYLVAMSGAGDVIIGNSQLVGDAATHGYRWTNGTMTNLGTLGGTQSTAKALSFDGAVVAGESTTAGSFTHAFRWANNTMTDLGTLGGTQSYMTAMSTTGDVIAGHSLTTGNTATHAYRWENGTMTDLGTIGSGTSSYVRAISGDGSVVAGYIDTNGSGRDLLYRWKQSTGLQSLESILTTAGVDFTGWDLTNNYLPMFVSDDGKFIAGTALFNGDARAYLFNDGGITTPELISQSLATVEEVNQNISLAGTSQLSQSLFIAQNLGNRGAENPTTISPSAGPYSVNPRSALALFTIAGYGVGQNNDFDNDAVNGTIGISKRVTDDLAIGAGVITAQSHTDLTYNGNSDMDAQGATVITAYQPFGSPLRLYGTAFAADLNIDTSRGYMNGAALDRSHGKTNGLSYGVAGQAGWCIPVSEKTSLIPYTALQWSKTSLDAYTETGGGFPASYSKQDYNLITSRLGIESIYNATEKLSLNNRLSWGHRINGNSGNFTANISGLSLNLSGNPGDRDWAEAATGLSWAISNTVHFNTELQGRFAGNTSEPALSLTVGMVFNF